jgi:hypothetical protein
MKNIFTLGLLAFLLLASCRKAPDIIIYNHGTGNDSSALVIRSGTSFGECMGYCRTMLEVDSLDLVFSEFGWGDTVRYPTKRQSGKLTASERQCLMSSVNIDEFMKLDTVIGCPDCADGGAEWIEIERKGVTRRVTFEYGHSIPAIQNMLDRIRLLREDFRAGNSYIYRTWEWVQSSGGLHGGISTPASTGYRQRAIYRMDGRYELYRNDSLMQSTTYAITSRNINGSPREVITYADQSIEQVLQLRGDTLELADQCVDCFDHLWVRATSVCGR